VPLNPMDGGPEEPLLDECDLPSDRDMTPIDNNNNGAMPSPPTPTATSATESGCPVLARRNDEESSIERPGLWSRWFSRSNADSKNSKNTQPNNNASLSSSAEATSECPARGNQLIPASIEEAANHSQIPHPSQRIPLSTQRVISSIPRGANANDSDNNAPSSGTNNKSKPAVPAHQPAESPRWQYPSEQQFYNAMFKKGYRPPVESIPSVLQIHNAVNEQSWSQVCRWERELHDNEEPRLVKFVGRPKDLSPRAWWNSRVFMTQEPFDRHDWYVEDVDGGEPKRYVIDFYEGKERTGDLAQTLAPAAGNGNGGEGKGTDVGTNAPMMKPPSMYIDVRPALDNPSAAADRMIMFVREALPGIAAAWDSHKKSSPSPPSSIAPVAEMNGSSDREQNGKQ